eukprot:5470699-Pyramimonas_sp.AAC.1
MEPLSRQEGADWVHTESRGRLWDDELREESASIAPDTRRHEPGYPSTDPGYPSTKSGYPITEPGHPSTKRQPRVEKAAIP